MTAILNLVSRHPKSTVTFWCFLLFIPFCSKPFHLDSPVTVYLTRQMSRDALNPRLGDYGRLLSRWNTTEIDSRSAYHATPHPPLVPLYLQPFYALFGENETVLNWAMFPFYLGAALFFFGLSRQLLSGNHLAVTLLFAASPVVVVNAQNVMLDLPLAAFIMGSFYFLFRSDRPRDALLSGIMAGLACLCKSTAGTLLFTNGAYYLFCRRFRHFFLFLIPFALINGAWAFHNMIFFGKIQFLANGCMRYIFGDIRYRFERLVSFLGGTIVFPLIPVATSVLRRRTRRAAILFGLGSCGWALLMWRVLGYSPPAAIFYAACATAGFLFLFHTGEAAAVETDRLKWIVIGFHVMLHVTGGLFLTLYASRYLLPFAFASLLAYARFIEKVKLPVRAAVFWTICIVSSALASMMLSLSDYQIVSAEKKIASDAASRFPDAVIHYAGRLGYLYYMDRQNHHNLDDPRGSVADGGLFVENLFYHDDRGFIEPFRGGLTLIDRFRYPLFPLTTLGGRAGFYGNDRLPYSIRKNHACTFNIYRYNRPAEAIVPNAQPVLPDTAGN